MTHQSSFGFAAEAATPTVATPQDPDPAGTAVRVIAGAMLDHPMIVAWSGGKDSTATLILALLAYTRTPAARKWPLHVCHNDTEVENPAVAWLARSNLARLEAWAEEHDLDIRVKISHPALSSSFVVKVLSGGTMPTYSFSGRRLCSIDWKLKSSDRALSDIHAELRQSDKDCPTPVVMVGTRYDESVIRSRNMTKRGEAADHIVDTGDRLLLSPIAHWTVDDVWELLGTAGIAQGEYPVWQEDFAEITAMYRDAMSGDCPVVYGEKKLGRTGCGARFGCATCTAVKDDRSMTAMTADPRHAYMLPLLHIRDYIAAIATDYTKRDWLSRNTREDRDRYLIRIQPDHFDSHTLQDLTAAYLYADKAEADRAKAFDRNLRNGRLPRQDPYVAACLESGEVPRGDYLERMRHPQFQFIDDRHLVGLDFYSMVLGKHRVANTVLEIAHRIRHENFQPNPLVAPELPHQPVPEPRWLEIPKPAIGFPGLGDPLTIALGEDSCFAADDIVNPGRAAYYSRETPSFDVDEESASMVVSMIYPDHWRRQHYLSNVESTTAIHSYLTLGTVSLSPQGRSRLHAVLKTRQAFHALGLYDLDQTALLARSHANHRLTRSGQATIDF